MSLNKSTLADIQKKMSKASKPKVPRNQWQHPGEITQIPGNNITMQGVGFPVLGIPNVGPAQMMQSGQDYNFPGASNVTEVPMMQPGGLWDSNRTAWVDSVNTANMDKNFVQRMYKKKGPQMYLPGDNRPSTHFMESGDGLAYPTVVQRPGNAYVEWLNQTNPDAARNYALDTGQYIQFANDEQATWYGQNGYKTGTGVTTGKPKKAYGGHGGLDRWFAEKWVDVKTGKACGRKSGESRDGYPACRPSKRINEDTPKTSSELSSSEKAKFTREKTSSNRINYQHRRREFGGEEMYNDMEEFKSGGNVPTNPALWSRAKSMARQKYDVYPSAYANGWASKWYKSKGGGWRKAEYGMEVYGDGGAPDNPGFRALPEFVQQQIINNMAYGGAPYLTRAQKGKIVDENGFIDIAKNFPEIGDNRIDKDWMAKAQELNEMYPGSKFVCTAAGCAQIATDAGRAMGYDFGRNNAWQLGNDNPITYTNPTYAPFIGNGMLPNPTSYKVPSQVMNSPKGQLVELNRINNAIDDSGKKLPGKMAGKAGLAKSTKTANDSGDYANTDLYSGSRGNEHTGFLMGNNILFHGTGAADNHPAFAVFDNMKDGISLPGFAKYEAVATMEPASALRRGFNTVVNGVSGAAKNLMDSVDQKSKVPAKKFQEASMIPFTNTASQYVDRGMNAGSNFIDKARRAIPTGESIVDYLGKQGVRYDKATRKAIAQQLGINNYDFSAAKNIELMKKIAQAPEILERFVPKAQLGTFFEGNPLTAAGNFISEQIPANVKAFGRYAAAGLLGSDTDAFVGKQDLNKQQLQAIYQAAMNAQRRTGKSSYGTKYRDYGPEFENGLWSRGMANSAKDTFTDPAFQAATALGRFSYNIKPDGSVDVTDQYDFNNEKEGVFKDAMNYIGNRVGKDSRRNINFNISPKDFKKAGGSTFSGNAFYEEGGTNNPGFRALPEAVQQKIISNMAYGGKMPEEIARARFAAAGNLDQMDDYGYAYGGYMREMAKGGQANGEMALSQINAMMDKLDKLRKFIKPDTELEPWQASKITLMDDFTGSVHDNMMYSPENQEQIEEMEEMQMMAQGGYTVTRSSDRKGKTHKVTGPDGTVKYFGDSKLGQHPKDPERKAAFYARHKKNLDGNPFFRAFARETWQNGGALLMKENYINQNSPRRSQSEYTDRSGDAVVLSERGTNILEQQAQQNMRTQRFQAANPMINEEAMRAALIQKYGMMKDGDFFPNELYRKTGSRYIQPATIAPNSMVANTARSAMNYKNGGMPCFECGGFMKQGGQHSVGDEMEVTPAQMAELKRQGYTFEVL